MARAHYLSTLLLALLLVACGGDDDSTPPSSSPPSPTPLPATVVSVSSNTPDGSYSTGHGVDITVTFSEPVTVSGGIPSLGLDTRQTSLGTIDAATSSAATATYQSGSGTSQLVFHYNIQAADRSDDLDYTDSSALSLNGARLKGSGNVDANIALPAPGSAHSLQQNANLRIINWMNITKAEADVFSSIKQRVYTAPNGNKISLRYQKISDSDKKLWATYYDAGTDTTMPEKLILQMGSTDQFDSALAVMRADGSAHIFWTVRNSNTNIQNLYTCLFKSDNSCGTTVDFGNKPASLRQNFFAGKEVAGKNHVLWVGNGLNDRVFDAATQTWSNTQGLTVEAMFDTRYLEDTQGNITVIWPRPTSYHLHTLRLNIATQTWSGLLQLENLPGYADPPVAALDTSGNINVIWQQRTSTPSGGMGQIAGAHFDIDTGSWTTPQFISTTPTSPFKPYTIAAGGAANLAVWVENRTVYSSLYEASSNSWTTPTPVDGGINGDAVAAMLDDAGNQTFLWQNKSSSTTSIFYGRYLNKAQNSWSSPVTLLQNSSSPAIRSGALQSTGYSPLQWIQAVGGFTSYDLWTVDLR